MRSTGSNVFHVLDLKFLLFWQVIVTRRFKRLVQSNIGKFHRILVDFCSFRTLPHLLSMHCSLMKRQDNGRRQLTNTLFVVASERPHFFFLISLFGRKNRRTKNSLRIWRVSLKLLQLMAVENKCIKKRQADCLEIFVENASLNCWMTEGKCVCVCNIARAFLSSSKEKSHSFCWRHFSFCDVSRNLWMSVINFARLESVLSKISVNSNLIAVEDEKELLFNLVKTETEL